jgi:hypothetical protein
MTDVWVGAREFVTAKARATARTTARATAKSKSDGNDKGQPQVPSAWLRTGSSTSLRMTGVWVGAREFVTAKARADPPFGFAQSKLFGDDNE